MSFAGKYLQKHAFRGPLINTPPHEQLHIAVVIPAYREPGLFKVLGSLFLCDAPGVHVEVIVLVNASEDTDKTILENNKFSLQIAQDWHRAHQRKDMTFHLLIDHSFPSKHAGVGLARKVLMDEAVRRFDALGRADGIILSLDADTRVEKNYLTAIQQHFTYLKIDGCSIYFEHPLEGEEIDWEAGNINSGNVWEGETWEQVDKHPKEVYDAIVNYELHLRYYLHAIRFTGYPFAYHTVGSAFAVRAGAYCSQGGMNKRQAGEDFYFIQKVAQAGYWSDCSSTVVYPSPRPSDRVIFGTGPDVQRQIDEPGKPYRSFDLQLFEGLREFYEKSHLLFEGCSHSSFLDEIKAPLREYLGQSDFSTVIKEIRSNSASLKTFTARLMKHFNMLWILKFLHWAEIHGYPRIEIATTAKALLDISGSESVQAKDTISNDPRGLLQIFRRIDSTI